jgi:membrane protein
MIDLSSRYALVYGSLASLVILMVWLYFCGNVLLLGAIVSQVACRRLDEKRQRGGSVSPAEA